MSDKEDAHQYRLLIAAGMLVLFRRANGREAASIEELQEFVRDLPAPFDVSWLTEDELAEARRRCGDGS